MDLFTIIKSEDMKLISPFVEGGISKLKKADKEKLKIAMTNYKKSDKEYSFDDNIIILVAA